MLKTLSLLIIISALFSCGNKPDISQNNGVGNVRNDENNQKIVANLEKILLEIDGMTCEIGCARTIQSKLSKTDGVKLAKVSFENKTGIVEFDSNKISKNQIVKIIEQIAGGDLYKVNGVKTSE